MKKFEDLSGLKFNKITVLNFQKEEQYQGKNRIETLRYWNCICECGKEFIRESKQIKRKDVKSCGCEKLNFKYRLPFGEAHFRFIEHAYKSSAKKRNIEWNLSREKFRELCLKKCFYCGREPDKIYNPKSNKNVNGLMKISGIDRMNSHKGYMIENCVPCCEKCNKAKSAIEYEKWVEWLDRIKNNWRNQ